LFKGNYIRNPWGSGAKTSGLVG